VSCWHLITGEYPPQAGGVSDYTRLVARELARAGDEVHIWAPACPETTPVDPGVQVHRLSGRFGPRELRQLGGAFRRQPRPFRLLVQYVPHMYGWKAMNVPFCHWLRSVRHLDPWVMFHEVAFPVCRTQPLRHNLLGMVNQAMARMVVGVAHKVFVSIPAWETKLRQLAPRSGPATWLPVPSNVATDVCLNRVAQLRRQISGGQEVSIIGHFGTYGSGIASRLAFALPRLLDRNSRRVALMLGRNGTAFVSELCREYPALANRVLAPGPLPPQEVAEHLKACDVLLQPYPDGVSSRRGSVMAGLALGTAIVSTRGELTEAIWDHEMVRLVPTDDPERLVDATECLLQSAEAREQLRQQSRTGYQKHFSIENTIRVLRADAADRS
jgi:glycosyltransferase involved in cell wall biosynthesis